MKHDCRTHLSNAVRTTLPSKISWCTHRVPIIRDADTALGLLGRCVPIKRRRTHLQDPRDLAQRFATIDERLRVLDPLLRQSPRGPLTRLTLSSFRWATNAMSTGAATSTGRLDRTADEGTVSAINCSQRRIIGQRGRPVGEREVRGDDDRAAFVAFCDIAAGRTMRPLRSSNSYG